MKKYALITGGAKGLGKAIAIKFAKNNINIGIAARDEKALQHTSTLIKGLGVDCYAFKVDLNKQNEVQKLADDAFKNSKKWDILVNNAGYALKKPLLELNLEDWDYIQNVNLRSVFQLSKLMVPQMIENKGGKIINISSLGAFFGTSGMAAYGVSKAGLNQLSRRMSV